MSSEIESRLAALEATVLQQGVEADDRLAEGVERLTDETAGLNTILRRVDEQQQSLSRLGRDLQRVESAKASKDELHTVEEANRRETLAFRKSTLQRVYGTAVALVLALVVVAAAVADYQATRRANQIDLCKERNKESEIILDILRAQVADAGEGAGVNPRIGAVRDGIRRFEALIIDCEEVL